jgi:hypothetical protein
MTPMVLALTAILLAADPPSDSDTKPMRKPHPLAPSLPQLTDEEEAKLDDIINRFIKADAGMAKGEDAKQAQRDFDALTPEAIPALIRGLNRAAQLDHSCPTLMIAKKLSGMLAATDDQKLLDFARDEIGGGVPRGKHAGVLADLRTRCLIRKNALARANPPGTTITTDSKSPRTMTNAELVTAASQQGGTKLKTLLEELSQRKGPEVLPGFSAVIKTNDIETQQFVRDLMDRNMDRQTATFVKEKLKDKDVEIRRSAARIAWKLASLLPNLIDALADEEAEVRNDAHQGLLKRSKGEDFGPAADAEKKQIEEAQSKWRSWLEKQPKR